MAALGRGGRRRRTNRISPVRTIGQEGIGATADRSQRSAPSSHRVDRGWTTPRRHRLDPSTPGDHRSLGVDPAQDATLGCFCLGAAGQVRRRSARAGLEHGMGPLGEESSPHPLDAERARAFSARAARWVSSASYLKKWTVLGVVIGAVAGLGAIVFYEALVACTHLFLGVLAGYQVPTPVGEGDQMASASAARPWALPLVAGCGALLGAILVYRFAPEAKGHGTDAAISAVHHNPRGVRFRAVIVKIVASALTIGSGGSGGREGPTGQISAGFGSLLATGARTRTGRRSHSGGDGCRVRHRRHLRSALGWCGAG